MAYNADAKADPASQPTYPQQQTYPGYQQGSYNGSTAGYSTSNQQSGPYTQTSYQQGAPYGPPPGPYPQGYQQPPPQQAAPAQPIIVTQPPVVVGQPMVMVGQCPAGQHIFQTQFGPCGIIAAILLFPIGLIFLFVDQQRRCTRCGITG